MAFASFHGALELGDGVLDNKLLHFECCQALCSTRSPASACFKAENSVLKCSLRLSPPLVMLTSLAATIAR